MKRSGQRVAWVSRSTPLRQAGEFFRGVVEQARALKLLSSEHFTVDGTLIEAWASLKSFKRKDRGSGQPPEAHRQLE